MHLALIVTLAYSLLFPPPQTELWQKVRPWSPVNLKSFSPSPAQLIAVKKALAARVQLDNTPCAAEDDSEWTENLEFEELPVSATQQIVLVSAGSGCARGAQGSNGAMWIIRFQGEKLLLLATPQQRFNGWLYSIQQPTSHGLRDLVLGWHMGGGETPLPLSYFRFDGTSYRRIGAAIKTTNEDGIEKITPKPASSGIGMEFTPPNSQ
jgi:hypothetical protein